MYHSIYRAALEIDRKISPYLLRCIEEKNSLVVALFHAIVDDKSAWSEYLYPGQAITKSDFYKFINYFKDVGYTFISPFDLLNGLKPNNRYMLITFDDGYYNNSLIIPILRTLKIPAIIFISTNFCKLQKCYWWDVFYRERIKHGCPMNKIVKDARFLQKNRNHSWIEKYLRVKFGDDCLKSTNDINRPFNIDELEYISNESFIFLGNHTHDHVYLKNCSYRDIMFQIETAQRDIFEIAGERPLAISFPFGKNSISQQVIGVSRSCGLKLIFSGVGKNYFPLKFDNFNMINRSGVSADSDLLEECNFIRLDFSLSKFLIKSHASSVKSRIASPLLKL